MTGIRRAAASRVGREMIFVPTARRRLPKVSIDYIDGGAEAGEVTLRENLRAFNEVGFRPRHGVAVPHCDLRTRVLGFELSMPVLLAPVGYCRVMHPDGEVAAARAAGAQARATFSLRFFGAPAGRCEGRVARTGLVPTVSHRWT